MRRGDILGWKGMARMRWVGIWGEGGRYEDLC